MPQHNHDCVQPSWQTDTTRLLVYHLVFGTLMALALWGCSGTSVQKKNTMKALPVPRVKPIPVSEMNERQKELLGIFDGEPLPKRAKSNLFRTLMHNPELTAVYTPMGDKVARSSSFHKKEKELIVMRIAWLYQSKYEWARHHANALAAGWTRADIQHIKNGPDDPRWNGLNKSLLLAIDQLVHTAYIADDEWKALSKHFSVPEIMEFITLITHYHWAAMITKSLGVEPEPEFPIIDFDD